MSLAESPGSPSKVHDVEKKLRFGVAPLKSDELQGSPSGVILPSSSGLHSPTVRAEDGGVQLRVGMLDQGGLYAVSLREEDTGMAGLSLPSDVSVGICNQLISFDSEAQEVQIDAVQPGAFTCCLSWGEQTDNHERISLRGTVLPGDAGKALIKEGVKILRKPGHSHPNAHEVRVGS